MPLLASTVSVVHPCFRHVVRSALRRVLKDTKRESTHECSAVNLELEEEKKKKNCPQRLNGAPN